MFLVTEILKHRNTADQNAFPTGEFMQQDNQGSFDHYLKKNYKKTASLMANCCKAVRNFPNLCSLGNEKKSLGAAPKNLFCSQTASLCLDQRWPNFLTRGPNSRLPRHWRAEYSAIYVLCAKIGC